MAQNPIVTFEMENGDVMKAELYPEIAPNTVNNFISLVKKGFYDGLIFHRVIADFMIQGGCPQGTGTGGPGYTINCEINPNKHERGTLAMAHAGRNTGGSQFYICYQPQPHLDGQHTVFGKVVKGMDVADKISQVQTHNVGPYQNVPTKPVVILSAKVLP